MLAARMNTDRSSISSFLARKYWSTAPASHSFSAIAMFDCVSFLNPTTFGEFEATVNGWADALLVLIITNF